MSVWYGPLNSPIHKSKSRERRSTNFRDANPGSTVGSSGTEKVFVSLLTDGLLMSVPLRGGLIVGLCSVESCHIPEINYEGGDNTDEELNKLQEWVDIQHDRGGLGKTSRFLNQKDKEDGQGDTAECPDTYS